VIIALGVAYIVFMIAIIGASSSYSTY
jgi:hypothetical protein